MTRRSTGSVVPMRSTNSPTACQQASMRPLSGYEQIGCNSTTPRLSCCGAHHNGVSICCQLVSFALANCQFCQSDRLFATSALISMLTCADTRLVNRQSLLRRTLPDSYSVRRSLPRHALLSLVHALVVSKVGYYNSVLAGMTRNLLYRLQSVLNAAARLVFSALVEGSGEDPVPAMRTGLPVPAQHRAVIPLRVAPTAADVDGRRLRSASSMTLVVPATRRSIDRRSATVRSQSQPHGPGTPCHWTSKPHRR